MNQVEGYDFLGTISKHAPKVEGITNVRISCVIFKSADDIRWVIDRNEFDELMNSVKESAPSPGGIWYSFYRCAGGLGSRFLFCAYKHVLEGSTSPEFFCRK